MNSANYCSFLEANFLPWMNSQCDDVKQSLIFQQDNAPSHASRYTKDWLADQGRTGDRIMNWPPQSPDLSPIENLWSIMKRKVYENGRQFVSKNDLWEAIKETSAQISPEVIKKLTSSVDETLVKVLKNEGKWILC